MIKLTSFDWTSGRSGRPLYFNPDHIVLVHTTSDVYVANNKPVTVNLVETVTRGRHCVVETPEVVAAIVNDWRKRK